MTFWKWSRTASTNATVDSTCPFPEGMAPSAVNDGVRGLMAAAAKYRDDMSGAILTTGTSTAYSIFSYQGFDSLAHLDGTRIAFTPHVGNGAIVTLNVDGLGAKPLRSAPGVELSAAVFATGTPYVATYFNATGEFILNGFFNLSNVIPVGTFMPYLSTTVPNSNFILPYGQALSRTTYATLFAMISTTFGSGDGTTTFNAPDLRGRVLVAQDNMGGTAAGRITTAGSGIDGTKLGASGGAQSKTLATNELPAHSHANTLTDPGHSHSIYGYSSTSFNGASYGATNPNGVATGAIGGLITSATTGITITNASTGGGAAFGIAQPSIILPYILRVI